MTSLGTTLQQGVQQRQEQLLSPAQFQALELLTAPVLELQQRIDQELALNPVLELESHPAELLTGDPVSNATEAELRPELEERIDRDDGFAELAELAEGWQDLSGGVGTSDAEAERRQEYYFNSLTDEGAARETLIEQLRWLEAPEAVKEAARHIVEALDERGYLGRELTALAWENGGRAEDYEQALQLVQGFEPAGIGARNLAESLTLQLERRGESDEKLFELVEKHLEEVAHNRLPQVAKALELTLPELREYLERLKGLSSAPGRELAENAPTGYVAPELKIRFRDGEARITGNDRWLPRLRINPEYLEMYNDPTTPAETKAYLRDKIMKAQELFGNLQFRSGTLHRIAEALTVLQHDFFMGGPDQLKPLTMRQVADRLGVHETTVSRAVSGKYVDTAYGVLELRKFFSGGYTNDSGEEVASSAIHTLIRELVDGEDGMKPLSDDAIAQELQKRGFAVARRTVAKYRTILGILPTNLRRKHV